MHLFFIECSRQHDLGLEPYHPADLFVKLLTPTLFLIITIMQVHYFHKDFIALSDPRTRLVAEYIIKTQIKPYFYMYKDYITLLSISITYRTNSVAKEVVDSRKQSNAGASTMRDDVSESD